MQQEKKATPGGLDRLGSSRTPTNGQKTQRVFRKFWISPRIIIRAIYHIDGNVYDVNPYQSVIDRHIFDVDYCYRALVQLDAMMPITGLDNTNAVCVLISTGVYGTRRVWRPEQMERRYSGNHDIPEIILDL